MNLQSLIRVATAGLASLTLLNAPTALGQGWTFVPAQAEWSAWPMHCKVQYSYISRGMNELARRYGQADIDVWRARVGEPTFSGLHHYCAALIYLRRLPLAKDDIERQIWLRGAVDDGYFTYARANPQSIVYPEIAVTMALARDANDERDEAVSILKRAISQQPQRSEIYGALALIYRKEKRLTEARDVLREAEQAIGTESAEIQYNLGLLNLELGDVDAAVVNAQRAYALNYPLPGLRRRLEALGRWQPQARSQ